MKINPLIFREYDIRGMVGQDLTEEFAYLLGQAFADLVWEKGGKRVAVGHDCRLSSKPYAQALAKGLSEGGMDVLLTGMGPTPQLYFSLFAEKLDGGIQVTGSHNPPDQNGFKLCLGTRTLSGPEIQELGERMRQLAGTSEGLSRQRGAVLEAGIQEEYIGALIQNSKPHMGRRKLKIVVDAGNGVGGMVGPAVLKALGAEVVELYCEPDGRFPNHHPDPTVLKNIEQLMETVRKTKADFGIGWDGDADRIGVVDEKGQVIFGDLLLLIYGRDLLTQVPGATIIGDVKCTSRLFEDLRSRGANVIMWKTGHSPIKAKLYETGAELGGEMSGHMFFKHRYYGYDDAIYAAQRFAEIVSKTDRPVSELLSDLPPMVATPEIRVNCPEAIKFKIPERAKSAFPEYKVETIDGARITFEHGWGLVRASNTQPVLVLRFEATNQEYLEKYQELVNRRIEQIQKELGSCRREGGDGG